MTRSTADPASRPFASASARNADAILGVLLREFSGSRTVLEIGSGTGQHAAAFATALPRLTWQASDLPENLDGIRSWVEFAAVANLPPPMALDVRDATLAGHSFDAVFAANTAHIMSAAAVVSMFGLAGHVLRRPGVFCLYGPFSRGGAFNAASNEEFDRELRRRDPEMGLRDLDELAGPARDAGLTLARTWAMPANNLLTVWIAEET